jgi:hypothetical protein
MSRLQEHLDDLCENTLVIQNSEYFFLYAGDVSLLLWIVCSHFRPGRSVFDELYSFLRVYHQTLLENPKPLEIYELQSLLLVMYTLELIHNAYHHNRISKDHLESFAAFYVGFRNRVEREASFVERGQLVDEGFHYDSDLAAVTPSILERHSPSSFRKWMDSIVYAHVFETTGVVFMNSHTEPVSNLYLVETAFQHLNDVYDAVFGRVKLSNPKKQLAILQHPDFVFFFTHVVYVLSDYGTTSLEKVPLPQLSKLVLCILEKLHRLEVIKSVHVEMLGELMDCASILGVIIPSNLDGHLTGMLLRGKLPPPSTSRTGGIVGSTGKRVKTKTTSDEAVDMYDRFHFPFCVLVGLSRETKRPLKDPNTRLIEFAMLHFAL